MKSILTIIILLTTICAFAQEKIDTLKVIPVQSEKINNIDKRLKELMASDVIKEIQLLETSKAVIIESEFAHANKSVPVKKEYMNGVILYIEDKDK